MLPMYMFELIQLSAWWEQVGEGYSLDFHDYQAFYCNSISQLPLTPLLLTLQIFPPPTPHHSLQMPFFSHHTFQISHLLTPHYTPSRCLLRSHCSLQAPPPLTPHQTLQISPPHTLLAPGVLSPPLTPHLTTTSRCPLHTHHTHHYLHMSPPHPALSSSVPSAHTLTLPPDVASTHTSTLFPNERDLSLTFPWSIHHNITSNDVLVEG